MKDQIQLMTVRAHACDIAREEVSVNGGCFDL
jgi:hypothetical protein